MVPNILKKKAKSTTNAAQAGAQGGAPSGVSSPPPPAAIGPQAAYQPMRPREPDYHPTVFSIVDQEWVHQVRFGMSHVPDDSASSSDLWARWS